MESAVSFPDAAVIDAHIQCADFIFRTHTYTDHSLAMPYIARQTGYTPEQAWRIASADVSVDYDPDTEPVQPTGQGKLTFAGYTVEAEPPRWKFHAMRNTQKYPDSFGNGADADIADGEIRQQRDSLWNAALYRSKNPGVFLHFFQDEVRPLRSLAEVLGAKVDTIHKRFQRAIQSLRECLSLQPEGDHV